MSLPILVVKEPKKDDRKNKLTNLNKQMDKVLSFVDHLNYRIMILQDSIDQFKKFKSNVRVSRSDDEESQDNDQVERRNISSSKGFKSKLKKNKTINELTKSKTKYLDNDTLQ